MKWRIYHNITSASLNNVPLEWILMKMDSFCNSWRASENSNGKSSYHHVYPSSAAIFTQGAHRDWHIFKHLRAYFEHSPFLVQTNMISLMDISTKYAKVPFLKHLFTFTDIGGKMPLVSCVLLHYFLYFVTRSRYKMVNSSACLSSWRHTWIQLKRILVVHWKSHTIL